MSIIKSISVLFVFFLTFFAQAIKFIHTPISDGFLYSEQKVSCYCDQTEVGFAYVVQCARYICVIHSLYVYPDFRCRGYGGALVKHLCSFLKKNGGKRIYIQPGPFELTDNGLYKEIDISSYEVNIQKLIVFYKKFGFNPVSNISSLCAKVLYGIVCIDENANYLMVKRVR